MNTNNKFIMECAIDYLQNKKDKVKLLTKINEVRKCMGVLLPYELVGENGRSLTNCGKMIEEKSSLRWKKWIISRKAPIKASKKAWDDFITWLRNKNMKTVKDFDNDCE